MEIASAFGPLKAYQFENSKDPDEPFAFLEVI
jgi:splicing factor U2AF subunit